MSARQIMGAIISIILNLKDSAANIILTNLILMLPYDTSEYLLHMVILFNNIQALTYHPTTMIIPDINTANAIFHQLLPLIPSEPSINVIIKQSLMGDLLMSLQAATFT